MAGRVNYTLPYKESVPNSAIAQPYCRRLRRREKNWRGSCLSSCTIHDSFFSRSRYSPNFSLPPGRH